MNVVVPCFMLLTATIKITWKSAFLRKAKPKTCGIYQPALSPRVESQLKSLHREEEYETLFDVRLASCDRTFSGFPPNR